MKTEIKTKRLTLCPMSDAEIEALIERTPSDELRAAYGEMLSGGKSDPGNRVWYAPWSMVSTMSVPLRASGSARSVVGS